MSLKKANRLRKIKYIQDNFGNTNKKLSEILGLPISQVRTYKSKINTGKIERIE